MNNQIRFLLIDSAYPINTRNSKILNSIARYYFDRSVDLHVCAWNRENKSLDSQFNEHIYKKESPGGQLFRKLCNLFGYYSFLRKCNKLIDPKVIIASHWDMLLLANFLKKKEQILIYENLDIPATTSRVLLPVLRWIERFSLRKVSLIVFASRFYKPLYRYKKCEQIILENKPLLLQAPIPKNGKKTTKKLILSYIGGIRYLEILKNLVVAVQKRPDVELFFHGEGHDLLPLRQYCEGMGNIFFTGRYDYSDIEKFYQQSDVVWAAYPNKDYNVKYAISNKFHESIYYRVPGIFSKKTKLGDLVDQQRIGFTVDPYSVNQIISLIDDLVEYPEKIEQIRENLSAYYLTESDWDTQFNRFISVLNGILDK